MNSIYFGNIDEILKSYGYEKCNCNSSESDTKIDPTAGAKDNYCRNFDSDVFYGFQDIDPMLSIVVCEILSNVVSNELPTNIANAYGNWLQLIAQVIVAFNTQQAYFQGGPGRYYNPVYRNVSNPFCTNVKVPNGGERSDLGKACDTNNDEDIISKKDRKNKEIRRLKEEIKKLKSQIEMLENEINSLE